MIYEYSGFLKAVLDTPDPVVRDTLPCVLFTADDIVQWGYQDLASDPEWQQIQVTAKRTQQGVNIEGRFNGVRQIDNLATDDPSFWVPLSSMRWKDPRFPIDTKKYPIAEITYRCTSPNARPAWMWTYDGGVYFDGLTPSHEWRTIVRRIQHAEFPGHINAVILRLYSISRTAESFEVESIRFREMSPEEAEACRAYEQSLELTSQPKQYPILNEFMPLGCYMDAGASKRLAAMLGISFEEYWALVFEDIARHHHNCIALEKIDRLTPDEWNDLLKMAEPYGIRFHGIYDLPLTLPQSYTQEFVETRIQPQAENKSLIAWSLYDEPPEHAFKNIIEAKALIEQADPNHPLAVMTRTPDGFPLFSRYASVSGMAHYASHVPWQVGDLVRAHLPASRGQQVWVVAPAFVYATDTPEWHTCPEMRLMMNLAIANGARGWYSYAYHNDPIWIRGSSQRSLTGPFLTFSDLWAELSRRVESYNALAPVFLNAKPEPNLGDWFQTESVAHANTNLPDGINPTSVYRLRGPDYELYCVVSNEIREMTTVHINIAPAAVDGMTVYDLSDFVNTRRRSPIPTRLHLEMFPGQVHIILIAKPDAAEHWHNLIAKRLVEGDCRELAFDLTLAQAYGLNVSDVEDTILGKCADPSNLEKMASVREKLLNLIYSAPALYASRSKLIETSAAVCACDGALCRLLGAGKADQARQLGFKVIPLARELTHLRLELRRGRGTAIIQQCQSLGQRTLEILSEIRSYA